MSKAAGSKPLTKTQADYAINRIATLTDQRIAKIKSAAPKPPRDGYTFTEKLAFIRSGEAKLKSRVYASTSVDEAFEYPDGDAVYAYNKAKKAFDVQAEKRINAIRKESQAVIDKLMMAGAQEALDAVTAYAAQVEAE